MLARLQPARADIPTDYAAAVAQRNAALRRAAAGLSSRDAIAPWTERVAALGAELVAARLETLAALEPGFREIAGELGLAAAALAYEGEPPTVERARERGSSATSTARRRASGRTCTTSACSRAIATCAVSARRVSSG